MFSCDGGPVEEHQRGLFFIEEGVIVSRVILPRQVCDERATHFTLSIVDRKLRGIRQSHSQGAVPMAALTVAAHLNRRNSATVQLVGFLVSWEERRRRTTSELRE